MLKQPNIRVMTLKTFYEQIGKQTVVLEAFQRNVVWTVLQMVKYVHSLSRGEALTPIYIANIAQCFDYCKKINHPDAAFFKDLLSQGKRVVSIDGQNRTFTIMQLIMNMLSIYTPKGLPAYSDVYGEEYRIHPKKAKSYNQLPPELRLTFDMSPVVICEVHPGTLADLRKAFLNQAGGSPLNHEEIRNANDTEFAEFIRELTKEVGSMWKHVITVKDKIPRFQDHKVLTECFIGTHRGTFRSWNASSKDLDAVYGYGLFPDGSRKENSYSQQALHRYRSIMKMVEECILGRPKEYKCCGISTFRGLVCACEYLYDNNYDFDDAGRFYHYVYQSDKKLQAASKAFEVAENSKREKANQEDAPRSSFYHYSTSVYTKPTTRAHRTNTLIYGSDGVYTGTPLDPKLLPYTLKYAIDNGLIVDDKGMSIVHSETMESAA